MNQGFNFSYYKRVWQTKTPAWYIDYTIRHFQCLSSYHPEYENKPLLLSVSEVYIIRLCLLYIYLIGMLAFLIGLFFIIFGSIHDLKSCSLLNFKSLINIHVFLFIIRPILFFLLTCLFLFVFLRKNPNLRIHFALVSRIRNLKKRTDINRMTSEQVMYCLANNESSWIVEDVTTVAKPIKSETEIKEEYRKFALSFYHHGTKETLKRYGGCFFFMGILECKGSNGDLLNEYETFLKIKIKDTDKSLLGDPLYIKSTLTKEKKKQKLMKVINEFENLQSFSQKLNDAKSLEKLTELIDKLRMNN